MAAAPGLGRLLDLYGTIRFPKGERLVHPLRFCAVLLILAVALASCAGRSAASKRLGLVEPTPTTQRLNAPAAFLAGVNLLNTYERFSDGNTDDRTTRTIVLQQPDPPLYRAHDDRGNWVEFDLDADGGLKINRAHNTAYGSWIIFQKPLLFAPAGMEQGERFTQETPITTWGDTWTTRTGQLSMTTWFAGVENIETGLGLLADCVRVDSTFKASLTFGLPFTATLNQRQWIHAVHGEVVRDIDGSYGIIGLPVRGFTSRHVLIRSRELRQDEQRALREEKVRAKPKKKRRP